MARNREPVKLVEVSQSESSEGDEGSSEEEESDADLDPTPPPPQKKPQPQMPAKPSPPLQATSSSEEEDSGSETESESDAPNSNVRPLAAKPVEETPISSSRKARSKPASDPVSPVKSTAAKRAAEDSDAKDAKKLKKAPPEPETAEKKSTLFQRLWSEDDEIVLLEGLIEYQTKYKVDPVAHLDQFHDFIKKSVHVDVTRTQLQDKIRRLKRKYGNIKSKEKNGKERTFSKCHEQMAYDLSKVIWGNEEKGIVKVMGSPRANGSAVRRAVGKKERESDEVKSGEGEEKRTNLTLCGATLEERVFIYGEEAFGSRDGESDWNKLKVDELKLYLKQLEIKIAQTKLVLAAVDGKDQ
ncbi:putative transcription factor [Salvia divinorum]|uniref:Transcription factor n=1 Tax=Salvia divinorum TaxID=28513 RepID=A0ABD1HAM1_SALDI